MKRFIALTIVALVVMTMLAACNSNSDIDVLNSVEPTEYVPTESPTVLPEITAEPTAHPTATPEPTPEPTATPEPAGELEQRILAGEKYLMYEWSPGIMNFEGINVDMDGDGLREHISTEYYGVSDDGSRAVYVLAINGEAIEMTMSSKTMYLASRDGKTMCFIFKYQSMPYRAYLSDVVVDEDGFFSCVRFTWGDIDAKDFGLYQTKEEYILKGYYFDIMDGDIIDFDRDGAPEPEVGEIIPEYGDSYFKIGDYVFENSKYSQPLYVVMDDGTIRVAIVHEDCVETYRYSNGTFEQVWAYYDELAFLPFGDVVNP